MGLIDLILAGCALSMAFIDLVLEPRQQWVAEKRISIINKTKEICDETILKNNCTEANFNTDMFYDKLLNQYWSFNKMVLHFWIWDINKMRNR